MEQYNLQPNELGNIPLHLLEPDPEQPRKDFDEDYINDLSESIKVDGVIQPIVVRDNPEEPGKFFIVVGENRWRASKKAELEDIPAIKRNVEGLDKLIVQLKENHQRKNLNAMEWALAFKTMNRTHGLKQAEIEKTLKESGVGHFGRSYISNMIRLLELPDWAQTLIRHGKISPSHGKFLLPAMASEKVISIVEEELTEEGDDYPTTKDLQARIYSLFNYHHIDLTSWKTSFDYKEKCVKTGCQKIRKISGLHNEATFCLDKQCHAILEKEAEEESEAAENIRDTDSTENESGPRELTFTEEGHVDIEENDLSYHRDWRNLSHAEFDTSECQTCKHMHTAILDSDTDNASQQKGCFLISCFFEKEDNAERCERLIEGYMRNTFIKMLDGSPTLSYRLLSWSACYGPNRRTPTNDESEPSIMYGGPLIDDYDDGLDEVLIKNHLHSLSSFISADDKQLEEIAKLAASDLSLNDLIKLWHHLNLDINEYRIDEMFIAEHTDDELENMFLSAEISDATRSELKAAIDDKNLGEFALKNNELLGAPAGIQFAFNQEAEKHDQQD